MITKQQVGIGLVITWWILLIATSFLLIKNCRIKYEIIPQTIQIESFTHGGNTYEYVKEFSYYDKKRNIHTITSNLFIHPDSGSCGCGIDYNYLKDGKASFKETTNQLIKLTTKQKFRIESEHLWYTFSRWRAMLITLIIIWGLILTIITTIHISNRIDYLNDPRNNCCSGCGNYCTRRAECLSGIILDDENTIKSINKFFGFLE